MVVYRYLHLNRHTLPCRTHRVLTGSQRYFSLQQILAGFDQQNIDAALNQRLNLFSIGLRHGVIGDVSYRGQLGGRTDRTGNEARLLRRGKLRGDFLRQFCGSKIQLAGFVCQLIFLQHDARGTECVRLDNIATYLQKTGVNAAYQVRSAEHEQLIAAFLIPIVVNRQGAILDTGAHGAVIDDHSFSQHFRKSLYWLPELRN